MPRPTLPNVTNQYRFSARDRYGNIRTQNDSCIATIDEESVDASPSAFLSVQWDGRYSPAEPGLRSELLPGYIVSFKTTVARTYSISVTLAPDERPDGGVKDPQPIPGSPFRVTVWPGEIDINRSSTPGPQFFNFPPLSSDLCGVPCRQTVANAHNNFTVVPRDAFGNVQKIRPSPFAVETPDAMFVRMGCSPTTQAQDFANDSWCRYDESHAASSECTATERDEYTCADTHWSTVDARFEAQMTNSTPTIAGIYTLGVSLGYAQNPEIAIGAWGVRKPYTSPSVWPQTREYAAREIVNGNSNEPFVIFVRPSELSPTDSSPGNGIDPDIFNSTEAGRNSSFAIVPRDRYSNIRDQTLFGFSDVVSVDMTARPCPYMVQCSDPRWSQPVVRTKSIWRDHSNLPNSTLKRPHFFTTFTATASGVYRLKVMVESAPELVEGATPLAGLSTVPRQLVGAAQHADGYTLFVVPAELDPANTYFLSLFSADTYGT
jgi:hypothetical protein